MKKFTLAGAVILLSMTIVTSARADHNWRGNSCGPPPLIQHYSYRSYGVFPGYGVYPGLGSIHSFGIPTRHHHHHHGHHGHHHGHHGHQGGWAPAYGYGSGYGHSHGGISFRIGF